MSELKFEVEVFNPQKNELQEAVNFTKDITADPKTITKEQLVIVGDARKKLMKYRTGIAKTGLVAREGANQYTKDVIAYEKELIEIIAPEEKRLKQIEDDVKTYNIREVRREKLPEQKERLASIGDDFTVTDNELLDMDPNDFEVYYNDRVALQNESNRIALEEKEKAAAEEKEKEEAEQKAKDEAEATKVKEEQDAKQKELDEKEAKIAEEAQKVENDKKQLERDKELENSKKEAVEQAEKDAKAKAELEAKEKEEAEARATQEVEEAKKKQEADEKYQKWLKEQNYDKMKDIITKSEETGEMILYKEVSRFTVVE